LTQVTAPTQGEHDYDPTGRLQTPRSPDRDDSDIEAAQLANLPDTSPRLIFPGFQGAIGPAISPNGKWVAFAKRNPRAELRDLEDSDRRHPGGACRFSSRQFRSPTINTHNTPDGRYVVFERRATQTEQRCLQSSAGGGPVDTILKTAAISHTVTPGYSPDGKIIVLVGTRFPQRS
jgi:Tol biopolymer transport system component